MVRNFSIMSWNTPLAIASAALIGLSATAGCDSTEPTGPSGPGADIIDIAVPTALVNRQVSVSPSVIEGEGTADPEFGALLAKITVAETGLIEDTDGTLIHWAEDLDGVRSAIRHCKSGDCVYAMQTKTGAGLTWATVDGTALEVRGIGRPVLLKNLSGHDLEGSTDVAVGALQIDKTSPPDADLESRRFVALNTFGEAFGTDLTTTIAAAQASGVFDEVDSIQYAREADVLAALKDLDRLDMLIWLTQGVREEVTSGWKSSRTVGFTVNRGGFGDKIMDRNAFKDIAQENVLGGPGVVFFAASQSYSDGNEAPNSGSVWGKFDDIDVPVPGDRILIGVVGQADVARIIAAATRFTELFTTGNVSLRDALAAGTAQLKGTGATLQTNIDDNERDQTFVSSSPALWKTSPLSSKAAPTSARAEIYITALRQCRAPGETSYTAIKNEHATAWAAIEFDGTLFNGTRSGTNGDHTIDTHIRGVLTGFEVGDRILVETWGNLDKTQFRDTLGFGLGTVREVTTDDEGVVRLAFDGAIHTAPFTDELGRECVMADAAMTTTAQEPSVLTLTP